MNATAMQEIVIETLHSGMKLRPWESIFICRRRCLSTVALASSGCFFTILVQIKPEYIAVLFSQNVEFKYLIKIQSSLTMCCMVAKSTVNMTVLGLADSSNSIPRFSLYPTHSPVKVSLTHNHYNRTTGSLSRYHSRALPFYLLPQHVNFYFEKLSCNQYVFRVSNADQEETMLF